MHHRKTYMYNNFQQNRVVDQSKPCTQIYLQKFLININLQLAIRISKNHAFRTCTAPSRTFRPILRSIGLLDIEILRKEIIFTDDRRQYDNNRTKQDAREAMRVVFSVLTKRICMHKTNFLRIYSNIILKVILICKLQLS